MKEAIISLHPNLQMNTKCYHIINICFGSVIICIILYSLIFNNYHPIPALLSDITGIIPPSKGMSAAFSEIVRGNFSDAMNLNRYSLRIFSFFVIQLFTRILVSISLQGNWITTTKVVIIDALFSIILFLICFAPLIFYTLNLFSQLFK